MQNVTKCCKMFLDVPECSRMHAKYSRMLQNELACSYMSLHSDTWTCMQLHKLTCSYISLHTVTWACMQFPELAYSCMSLHAVLWAYLQLHELACSSFLRLSSSQEFRSACLNRNRRKWFSRLIFIKALKGISSTSTHFLRDFQSLYSQKYKF